MSQQPQTTALSSWGNAGIQLRGIEDAMKLAEQIARTDLAPKGMAGKPADILVAMQMGAELGMSPMMALQNIAVINGRPGIFGDAALALCEASGKLTDYRHKITGEGDARKAVVTAMRKNRSEPMVCEFSVADAKKAQLWGKAGPWSQYPDRMLMFRARAFLLRDLFPDVLKGFRCSEELADMPAERQPAPAAASTSAAASPDLDVGELQEAAAAAAAQGTAAYREHWQRIGQAARTALKPWHDGNKAAAVAADEKLNAKDAEVHDENAPTA